MLTVASRWTIINNKLVMHGATNIKKNPLAYIHNFTAITGLM